MSGGHWWRANLRPDNDHRSVSRGKWTTAAKLNLILHNSDMNVNTQRPCSHDYDRFVRGLGVTGSVEAQERQRRRLHGTLRRLVSDSRPNDGGVGVSNNGRHATRVQYRREPGNVSGVDRQNVLCLVGFPFRRSH